MVIALLVTLIPPLMFDGGWQEWIYKGLTLLLIGCPCALVISTPAAITSGLAAAARRGALIKGGAALEQLGRITQVAFDKTGTLTIGKPRVTAIHPASGISEAELLALAAAVEQGATHRWRRLLSAKRRHAIWRSRRRNRNERWPAPGLKRRLTANEF